MGELNTVPMRINGVEGAAGQVKKSGGPGVLETWGAAIDAAGAVTACEAAGLSLASGKNIKLIANLTSNQTWSGLTAVLQAGEIITRTELVYVKNDGKMWLAQANAAATMPAIAMACPATIAADAWGEFLLVGMYREDSLLTFGLGNMLYVSDTVAGAFDNVLPDDTGEQVQVLGKCLITTHIIYFHPSLELVERS